MVPYQVHEIVHSSTAKRFDEAKKVIIGGASLDKVPKQNFRNTVVHFIAHTE